MENEELLKEIMSIKYEIWDINKLIPYARNPRKNDHVIDKMAGQIKEFGMPVPICIRPDGSIVDGHLRYKACKKLNLLKVPVAVNQTWSPEKIKAFRISVNKTSEWAEWDKDFLVLEVKELESCDFDLDLLGFSPSELNEIIDSVNLVDDHTKEWKEMPEFQQDDQMSFRNIKIHFKDQQSINEFMKLVNQKITDKTKYIWFPQQEKEKVSNLSYET